MSRSSSFPRLLAAPPLCFLLALLAVWGGGAVLLGAGDTVAADSRHLAYWRHYWQAAFDALSAACGAGLLTYDFRDDYTPAGRWVLSAVGWLGAALYLAAAAQVLRRARGSGFVLPAGGALSADAAAGTQAAGDAPLHVPHPLTVVALFAGLQGLAVAVGLAVRLAQDGAGGASEYVWRSVAAACSLGWAAGSEQNAAAWPFALLMWVTALGWPAWFLLLPRRRRRCFQARQVATLAGVYTLVLMLAALLVSALESPRGARSGIDPGASAGDARRTLSEQRWARRYARSLVQVVAASGAGAPTEPLAGRDATPGTKVVLAALLLIGGLGGSPTGGVQWPLLLWALVGGAAAVGWKRGAGGRPAALRCMLAGLAAVFLLALLALVVALGLLLLETWTASHFQSPPGLADALLDASSIVAGGNLTGGLTEAVTSRNLLSGIRQASSQFQYGMAWLMLAMLAGRMLPLVIVYRLGAADGKPPTANE